MAEAHSGERGPGFDDIIARLETLVTRLEDGELPLEEALSTFEQGIGLAREGERILGQAERRVELLLRGKDGEPTVAPFETDAADGPAPER
jgi:exodeoxyribonuclease VII small subunit